MRFIIVLIRILSNRTIVCILVKYASLLCNSVGVDMVCICVYLNHCWAISASHYDWRLGRGWVGGFPKELCQYLNTVLIVIMDFNNSRCILLT